jgi:uncharacterized membrane protein YphA (DoxX/SURF4 family)
MFLTAGTLKLTQPRTKLESFMPWVKHFSTPVVRFVGFAELLGAIGVVVPALVDKAVWLSPLAAAGLGLLMLLAAIFHFRKAEWSEATFNAVIVVVAVVVAVFRFGPNSF